MPQKCVFISDVSLEIEFLIKELSLWNKPKFANTKSLQFDLTKLVIWNIKSLWNEVAKIQGLENQSLTFC